MALLLSCHIGYSEPSSRERDIPDEGFWFVRLQGDILNSRRSTHEELEQRVRELEKEVTKRKQGEKALRESQRDLKIRISSLKDLNASLKFLVRRREEDAKGVEQKVMSNVKELVVPFLERLKKTDLDSKQMAYLDVLEATLNAIISPFSRTLSTTYETLTPTEIQVANLIKDGKITRQIAQVMHLSPRTIDAHRHKIRQKLGLKTKRSNLRSRLLSLQ
ncbi:MAG TPA: helix-turn-helix transcriptional regulator [Desulfatiglandales bacterium]|nr:helix-turn-helix transcriptional regulator [Desulfatiglandales bacterium]